MALSQDFNQTAASPEQLLAAVRAGGFKAVRAALENDVPADTRDADGNSALMLAVGRGDVTIAGMLIGYGADVNLANVRGETPLDAGLAQKKNEMLDLLLASGAETMKGQRNDQRDRLLLRASARGAVQAISDLLGAGVSLKVEDDEGRTPLFLAAQNGQAAAAGKLLQAGAVLNEPLSRQAQVTPLRAAMKSGNLDCVKVFLAAGADPGADGKAGDRVNTDHEYSKKCAADIAAAVDAAYQKFLINEAAKGGDEATVRELLAKGEPVDTFDRHGKTALFHACACGNAAMVRILLDHHANPSLETKEYQAPLKASVTRGDTAIAEMLMSAGAVQSPIAIHEACGRKFPALVRLLLKHGANHDTTARSHKLFAAPGDFFITTSIKAEPDDYPLHIAIRNSDPETVAALTAAGARTVTLEKDGLTAVQLAQNLGNPAVLELVKERREQEIDDIADSAVRLDQHTTPLKALKFKPKTGP